MGRVQILYRPVKKVARAPFKNATPPSQYPKAKTKIAGGIANKRKFV